MSRKIKKRLKRLCDDLAKLAVVDPVRLSSKFDRCIVRKALRDIGQTARTLKNSRGAPDANRTEVVIFAIYQHVDTVLKTCGSKVDDLVGARARREVLAECDRAVCDVYGIPRRLTGRYHREP